MSPSPCWRQKTTYGNLHSVGSIIFTQRPDCLWLLQMGPVRCFFLGSRLEMTRSRFSALSARNKKGCRLQTLVWQMLKPPEIGFEDGAFGKLWKTVSKMPTIFYQCPCSIQSGAGFCLGRVCVYPPTHTYSPLMMLTGHGHRHAHRLG